MKWFPADKQKLETFLRGSRPCHSNVSSIYLLKPQKNKHRKLFYIIGNLFASRLQPSTYKAGHLSRLNTANYEIRGLWTNNFCFVVTFSYFCRGFCEVKYLGTLGPIAASTKSCQNGWASFAGSGIFFSARVKFLVVELWRILSRTNGDTLFKRHISKNTTKDRKFSAKPQVPKGLSWKVLMQNIWWGIIKYLSTVM